MTSQKDAHLETIRGIRSELLAILDGMDYCLDWKPNVEAWSAREVVYHLVDTPEGGIHKLIAGILSSEIREFDLMPDLNNMNPERQSVAMDQIREDVLAVLNGLEFTVSATGDHALNNTKVLAHLLARGINEERTPQVLLEGLFARHWRGHLEQLKELRDSLGV